MGRSETAASPAIQPQNRSGGWKRKAVHIFLIVFVIVDLAPVVWLLLSSVKTNEDIAKAPWGWPESFHWENFVNAWKVAKLGTYFTNSVVITVAASVLTILLAAMAAYAVSRYRFRTGNRFFYGLFLLGLIVPVNALLIPLYLLVNDLHLYGTRGSLIITYTAFQMAISFFIIESFMRSIPNEIEEAGIMDGCGSFQLFFRVMLPMTRPALATVFILNLLQNWNEFILALLFSSGESIRTIPVGMANFSSQYQVDYATMAAGVLITILPVILAFIVLRNQIMEGMTAGAVKG